jgi:hypothetical protein
MLFAKHAIITTAGTIGGIFGYVSAENDSVTLFCAFAGMFICGLIADVLTQPMEVNEDGDD